VVFIEHRYYGQTQLPDNLEPFAYLDTTQVLWDYADIVAKLKPNPQSKVIAFGGSYGGMLAAMFRLKFP
jgi:lysosomal Pro-X carboxypeptidase